MITSESTPTSETRLEKLFWQQDQGEIAEKHFANGQLAVVQPPWWLGSTYGFEASLDNGQEYNGVTYILLVLALLFIVLDKALREFSRIRAAKNNLRYLRYNVTNLEDIHRLNASRMSNNSSPFLEESIRLEFEALSSQLSEIHNDLVALGTSVPPIFATEDCLIEFQVLQSRIVTKLENLTKDIQEFAMKLPGRTKNIQADGESLVL